MVESGREYVLQWPGHPAYITERFSGLFAKQALVDLTLLCDEQKLRVHKLVLASCSLYFEEILADDLGAEPVILFKDLDFNILKAMIEFMYCGETTVSHIHLPSLLAAARSFKVKELESLVEKMVGLNVPDYNDNKGEFPSKSNNRLNGMINNDDNDIRVSCVNGTPHTYDSNSDSETGVPYHDDRANERCLYEEQPCIHRNGEIRDNSVESVSSMSTLGCGEKERYCDFDKSSTSLDEEINPVGQCSRVYTHKRRKTSTEDNNRNNNNSDSSSNNSINKRRCAMEKSKSSPVQHFSSNRIDLDDESSNEGNGPVTLDTNLESPDYMLSFSNESIQSIVGCSISDFCKSNGSFELLEPKHVAGVTDEIQGTDIQPALRRSERLNQQENEEIVPIVPVKHKTEEKIHRPNKMKQLKRKNTERRVPNVKLIVSSTQQKKPRDKGKTTASTSRNKEVDRKQKIELDSQQLNCSASVSRALWGDMSDIREQNEEYEEYSHSTDIPFAVGLLPLRAALEKLQATPDYQPRKTRSSTASTSKQLFHDTSYNGYKRKHSPVRPHDIPINKKIVKEEERDSTCSVQKSTSPMLLSQPRSSSTTSSRKRSLSEGAAWTKERMKSIPDSP